MRNLVAAIAVAATIAKLFIAATTFGSNDVRYWTDFAEGAAGSGPWNLYGIDFAQSLYNHGPLTSWFLVGIGPLHDLGLSYSFLIRAPACLADLVTALVVFELVSRVRGRRSAALSAVLIAWSPVSLIISGFHGNTDPVFVMLALSAVLLAVDARGTARAAAAGVVFGLAISVKTVPIVALPVLIVLVVRRGRGPVVGLVLGGAAVFLLLWVPVLIAQPSDFVHHYMGYSGIDLRQWGFSQLAAWAGISSESVISAGDRLRFGIVFVAAMVPAYVARRRSPDEVAAMSGLPFCLLLVASPAFSMQYLAWAVAPALLCVRPRVAAPWIASSSAFALIVYSGWNHAWPWRWSEAIATPLPAEVLPLMVLTWLCLALVVRHAIHQALALTHPIPRTREVVVTHG